MFTDKKEMQTFSDFKEAGFNGLYVSVTYVTKHGNDIFSLETAFDIPVANAVSKQQIRIQDF